MGNKVHQRRRSKVQHKNLKLSRILRSQESWDLKIFAIAKIRGNPWKSVESVEIRGIRGITEDTYWIFLIAAGRSHRGFEYTLQTHMGDRSSRLDDRIEALIFRWLFVHFALNAYVFLPFISFPPLLPLRAPPQKNFSCLLADLLESLLPNVVPPNLNCKAIRVAPGHQVLHEVAMFEQAPFFSVDQHMIRRQSHRCIRSGPSHRSLASGQLRRCSRFGFPVS